MRQADQNQKQAQLGQACRTECGGNTNGISNLFQDEEQAEDGALAQFLKRESVELAPKETAEGLDARGGPRGEVGEGAFLDTGALAERLAKEDGRGRVTVRDGVDKHGHHNTQYTTLVK